MFGSRHDRLSSIKELHRRGVAGDRDAAREACALLEKARDVAGGDNLVEAYYGSVLCLMGRDAVDPGERFGKALRGLKILDRAVANEPGDAEIRLLRAYVCLRLPEAFFHRVTTAVADLSALVARYEQDRSLFTANFFHQLLFDLGLAYKLVERPQEAEEVWRGLLARTRELKYRKLLRLEGFGYLVEADPALEADLDGVYAKLAEGLELHRRAVAGDREATRVARAYFAKALEDNPGDPLIVAYNADCLSMMGRDAASPPAMFASAIMAARLFDSAVNAAPENIRVRLLRANHGYRLPEVFFQRTATAIADYEYSIARYEQDDSLFPLETYCQLLYNLGDAYYRLGLTEEGENVWARLLRLEAGEEYAERVAARMSREEHSCAPEEGAFPLDRDERLKVGMHLHDLAVAGDRAAARKAVKLWQKAHEASPEDALCQGYYGSSLALAGRYSLDSGVLFKNTVAGLKHLNAAVGKDGDDHRLRLLRAYLAYSLPETFFHLTQQAIEDFRWLKTAYDRDGSIFPRKLHLQIALDLSRAEQRLGGDVVEANAREEGSAR